jgi:hypothetical protein
MNRCIFGKRMLLAIALIGSAGVLGAADKSAASGEQSTSQPQTSTTASAPGKSSAPVRYLPSPPRRALMYYEGIWGIDELKVKYTESGEMVRFSWRVVNPQRAKLLNDKKTEPFLIDLQAGVKLVVPTMEKVGQLRQSSTPEAGKSYWMAFSNSGRRVKRGDHVDVVIGKFRTEGLVVE